MRWPNEHGNTRPSCAVGEFFLEAPTSAPHPHSERLLLSVVWIPHQVLSMFSCLPSQNLVIARKQIRDDSFKVTPARPQVRRFLPALGTTGCTSCFRFSPNANSLASPPCPPSEVAASVIITSHSSPSLCS